MFSQDNHSGRAGDMNDASMLSLERCGSHTRGAHCQLRPMKATAGAEPLMQRTNSRKIHLRPGIFFASTVQM